MLAASVEMKVFCMHENIIDFLGGMEFAEISRNLYQGRCNVIEKIQSNKTSVGLVYVVSYQEVIQQLKQSSYNGISYLG